jgi:hypothetical protein
MSGPREKKPSSTAPTPPSERTTAEAAWAGEIEQAFSSTTWGFRRVEIRPPARAKSQPERSEDLKALLVRLRRREMRKPLEVTVRFRGGPECWWELTARGRVWRFPGYVALHDALAHINASHWPKRAR